MKLCRTFLFSTRLGRSPCGERGLKSICAYFLVRTNKVAPRAGSVG